MRRGPSGARGDACSRTSASTAGTSTSDAGRGDRTRTTRAAEETDRETIDRLNTQHGVLEAKLDTLIRQSSLAALNDIVAAAVAEGQRKQAEAID